MHRLRRLFDFYLDASVHTAVSVFALIEITGIFFGIDRDHHFAYLVFFGTIVCYNFVKYGVEAKKYILVANTYHRYIQVLSFIAGGGALYHAFYISVAAWTGIAVLLGLTALYAVPLLPHAKNLRSLGGLKIFVVALVWAGTTVVLPVVSSYKFVDFNVWIETVQRFILVLLLMVPFEIRDLEYDDPELRTLPQRYGISNTKMMGGFGTILFFFLTFLKTEVTYLDLIAKGSMFLVMGGVIYVTQKKQSRYFASFWVEVVPVFWWGFIRMSDNFLATTG
ncbi:MAG TPA: hypothetical protein VLZ54_10440 [Arenibacter sp.]|nr:hypothetical protein [Arenibacter sp.]